MSCRHTIAADMDHKLHFSTLSVCFLSKTLCCYNQWRVGLLNYRNPPIPICYVLKQSKFRYFQNEWCGYNRCWLQDIWQGRRNFYGSKETRVQHTWDWFSNNILKRMRQTHTSKGGYIYIISELYIHSPTL